MMKKSNHIFRTGFLALTMLILLCSWIPVPGSADDYESYWNENYALSGRDYGVIGKMKGNIDLVCVFVNDSQSHWTDSEIQEMYDGLWKDTAYLENQAAHYGTHLKFSSSFFLSNVPANQESRWLDYLLETQFGNPENGLAAVEEYYAQSRGYDACPILFYFNKPGRCYSIMASRPFNEHIAEYAVYFPSTMDADRSPAHELYHLFGGIDLYYPDKVAVASKERFPNSSMLIGGREIDDLTAYLIGWTDHCSQKAEAFLNDIRDVTREDVDAARPAI